MCYNFVMKNLFRIIIIALIAAINIGTFTNFFLQRDEYHFYLYDPQNRISAVAVEFEKDGIVDYTGETIEDGYHILNFKAVGPGEVQVYIYITGEKASEPITLRSWKRVETSNGTEVLMTIGEFEINEMGTLLYHYSEMNTKERRFYGYDYNQWPILWLGFAASLVLLCVLFFVTFFSRIKRDLYSYKTMLSGGLAIFFLAFTMLCFLSCLTPMLNYRSCDAWIIAAYFSESVQFLAMLTVPFVILFSIAVTISNIVLIIKEGFRKKNLLGIAVSVVLLIAFCVCYFLPSMLVTPETLAAMDSIQYALLALYCFFLFFLLSAIICALTAAKRIPPFDQDYVIILGCAIKKDGTLLPLLRGRVDRAIWFWKKQAEETGKQIIFIPSGGQGSDEVISEGEAMKRYLIEQGVPEHLIHPETASATTLQNMKFSKDIIDAENPDAKVIFSTTNYHVFRSGILARQAGLNANGIGSKTKWYFWPNAFLREFAGLLVNSWKYELIFLIVAVAILLFVKWVL